MGRRDRGATRALQTVAICISNSPFTRGRVQVSLKSSGLSTSVPCRSSHPPLLLFAKPLGRCSRRCQLWILAVFIRHVKLNSGIIPCPRQNAACCICMNITKSWFETQITGHKKTGLTKYEFTYCWFFCCHIERYMNTCQLTDGAMYWNQKSCAIISQNKGGLKNG